MGLLTRWTKCGHRWALLLTTALCLSVRPTQASRVTIVSGSCQIEVDRQNAGIVEEFRPVCGDTFELIRSQLGAPPLERPIPVWVVVRTEELAAAVPGNFNVPPWAAAYAVPNLPLVVVALRNASGAPNLDLNIALAHELSHVALHQSLGGKAVPRWFSEGLAIQQSEALPIERFLVLLSALRVNRIIPLANLETYPVHAGHVDLAYAEAADFVGFLLRKEGYLGVRYALRRYTNGDTFDQAIATAFHSDVAKLERMWLLGLPTTATWIALFTSDGLLWGFTSILLLLAYRGARKRHRSVMARLEAEDALTDVVWSAQGEETSDRRH